MDFRRIQHFIHVAELGSLSKAAERLNIVQPALTQSIKRLEVELDELLFTRSRRGMSLTEPGHVFLKYAYGILNQYNRAKEAIATVGDNPMGLVSVAMTSSALQVLTVPIYEDLQANFPDIILNIEEGLAGNIQQGFEAGKYDLVLSYFFRPDPSIHIEKLIEEELYLTMPYDASSSSDDIPFIELHDMPLILPQDQHGVGTSLSKHAEEKGIKIVGAQVNAAMHPTLQLVESGFGNSLLPFSAIHTRIEQKRLMARKIVRPQLHHIVSMISPTHRPFSPATLAVMQMIRKAVMQVHSEGKWRGRLLVKNN